MILALLWSTVARADCPEDAYSRVLHAASRSEYAFAALDEPAIVAAAADLRGALPCVRSPLSAPDAAQVHRAAAIIAFFEGKDDLARQAWASARALQPAWEPGATLMPPGHELHTLWLEASTLETGSVPSPYAAPGGWFIDGLRSDDLPTGRPFVLQGLAADGAVAGTSYQWSPEIPDRSRFGFSDDVPAAVAGSGRRPAIRTWGTAAGLALGVGAGTSLALGGQARGAMEDADYEDIAGLERRSDSTTVASAALGAASALTLGLTWGVSW